MWKQGQHLQEEIAVKARNQVIRSTIELELVRQERVRLERARAWMMALMLEVSERGGRMEQVEAMMSQAWETCEDEGDRARLEKIRQVLLDSSHKSQRPSENAGMQELIREKTEMISRIQTETTQGTLPSEEEGNAGWDTSPAREDMQVTVRSMAEKLERMSSSVATLPELTETSLRVKETLNRVAAAGSAEEARRILIEGIQRTAGKNEDPEKFLRDAIKASIGETTKG